jgi:hypothetical protein
MFAGAALLALALGVLGMHAAADLGATAHVDHSSHECHHDDCAPTPMSGHVGALCVVAAAVAIAAVALTARRRGGTWPAGARPSHRLTRPAARQQVPGPGSMELCVLRC